MAQNKEEEYKIKKYLKENFTLKGFFDSFRTEFKLYLAMGLVNILQMSFIFGIAYIASDTFSYPDIFSFTLLFLFWRFVSHLINDESNKKGEERIEIWLSVFFVVYTMISTSIVVLSSILLSFLLPLWISIPISVILGLLGSTFGLFTITSYADANNADDLSKSEIREMRLGEILGKDGK